MSFNRFVEPGKASFIFGGQFGSEGKGLASSFIAIQNEIDLVVTNNGPNSGHTSVVGGVKRVSYHLPTTTVVSKVPCYLSDGAVINVDKLMEEIENNNIDPGVVFISPSAAVISEENLRLEKMDWSPASRIASTQKGVGAAIASKVMRSARLARDVPELSKFIRKINVNHYLGMGSRILVEVPQGYSLSIDNHLCYPYVTSRNCGVMQAMSDAKIHPKFVGNIMAVVRSYPIRVGHIYGENGEIIGDSGPMYQDQEEITFEELGVQPEFTTVTGRKRRIFTFSRHQFWDMFEENLPTHLFFNFANYMDRDGRHNMMDYFHCEEFKFRGIAVGNSPETFDVEIEAP